MLIWFAAGSIVAVALVFQSPGMDYRAVALGAVLPLAEQLTGGPKVLHSAVVAMALTCAIVAATGRRRLLRRRLIGLPIGMMLHLVLDGSFARTGVFWWPVTGLAFAEGPVPEVDHLTASLVLEVVGVGLAVWIWRHFGLADPARRQRFLRDGRLDPVAGAPRRG